MLDICGTQAVYVPINDCGECSAYESRIKALESQVKALITGASQQAGLNTQFSHGISNNASALNTLNETVSQYGTRIYALESKVSDKEDVVISKTDSDGVTVTATVLASVE